MVMECPPSPDSVGRELVRQYYTLLNKAPTHLHRFYNNQSSFVHGGLDPPNRETLPMIGQKQIHQKIQQLNFQDCHAKIIQVDAQATLGNGVVVQVTGELSNAGQPMRRFTQTFVLAAQTPKKYYVHNDIFRYQDEIINISDEECENEGRPAEEGDLGQERHEMQPMSQASMGNYYNPNNAPLPPVAQQPHHQHHMMQAPPPQPPLAVPTVNGAVHQDELLAGAMQPALIANPSTPSLTVATSQAQPQVVPVAGALEETMTVSLGAEEGAGDATDYIDPPPVTSKAEIADEMGNESISNEPKTYATLLKSGGGFTPIANSNVFAGPVPPPVSPPPIAKVEQRDGQQFQMNNQRNHRGGDTRGNVRSAPPLRQRPDMRSQPPRPSDEGGNAYSGFDESMNRCKPLKTTEERRRSQTSFAEGNQLFLGNLPLSATDDDLREVFEKFGPIADLRIHSKPNKGGPGTRAPPNYGFITYETPEGAQTCLAAKPIQLPGNDKYGPIVLNVEEKKNKERPFGGNTRNHQGEIMSPRPPRDNNGPRRGAMLGGPPRGVPMGGPGAGGGGGPRPNSFNRSGPANRGSNNSYSRR